MVVKKYFILIIAILIFMVPASLYAEEIVIIANKEFPVNQMTAAAIRDIYLGDMTTEGGIKIKPYDQKDSKIRKDFLAKVIGTNEDKYNAYWIKKVFQEGGIPPIAKSSSEDIIKAVKEEMGGIGYVRRREGDIAGVKILLIVDIDN